MPSPAATEHGRSDPLVAPLSRGLLAAVALLSASALAFEVLLIRVFAIAQWHHFAHMILSLALLGFGAGGTALVFARGWLLARFSAAFPALAVAFAAAVPASVAAAGALPLNLMALPWDWTQPIHLGVVYAALAVPFFFAGAAIGLALVRAGGAVGSVYRSDLIGAGAGAAAVVAALFVASIEVCIKVVAGCGLAAAILAVPRDGSTRRVVAGLLVAGVAAVVSIPDSAVRPQPSPYKDLSRALTVPGAEVVAESTSPLGLLTVVHSPDVPWRHVPGLSLASDAEPPEQRAVFTDGGGMTAITRFDGDTGALRYLDQQTAALPYHLLRRPRVLVLGAGGGADVLLARFHRAPRIDAVEVNPQMVDLVRREFAEFAGPVFAPPEVRVHVAEARTFVARTTDRFDLINLSLLESFTTASAGLHALSESTLYTVEALGDYVDRLSSRGILSITRWAKAPPRDAPRLLATAAEVLRERGVGDPGSRIALVRGWQTTTLLVAAAPLSDLQIGAIRRFCATRAFDVAWLAGMDVGEANRVNVLDRPYLREAAAALLGGDIARRSYIARYPFDIRPATDDRPYFFLFLKGRGVVDLLTRRTPVALGLVDWGYPVLLATLVQAVVVGGALILLPLTAFRGPRRAETAPAMGPPRGRIVAYFLALGLAFLFVEIAFIQKFRMILGHPLYAVAVVLASFLVFAGLGAGAAQRWTAAAPERRRRLAGRAVAGIAALVLLYAVALPAVTGPLVALGPAVRVALAIAAVAPLAFLMGMPFPLGLAATAERAPPMVPWAWGINGCASVISAVLATLLAVHLGFTAVVIAAVGLYALAAWAFPAGPAGSS